MTERAIPGTVVSDQRGFCYVEGQPDEIRVLLRGIAKAAMALAREPDGGILSENVEITLPTGQRLQGVSFNRDLPLWSRAVQAFADAENRRVGRIEDQHVISAESRIKLQDCDVRFYELPRSGRKGGLRSRAGKKASP